MEDFNKKESRKVLTAELKVQKTYLELVPRPSDEDYQRLKDSIAFNGFDDANPIKINEEMIVLDGHTRLQIAKELGLEWVYSIVKDLSDHYAEKKYIIETNLNQRHFTSKQKVEVGEKLLEIRKDEARARQLSNLKQYGKDQESGAVSQDALRSPNVGGTGDKHSGEAMDQTARDIGIGRETLRKGLKVKDAARTDPEIAAAWEDKATTINQVYHQVKEKEKETQTGEGKQRPKVVFAKIKTWKEEREEYRKKREERGLKYQVPREELVETFREAAKLKQMPMDAVEALMESDPEFLQVWKKMRLGMVTLTVGWCVIYWKIHVWFRSRQGLEPSQEFHRRIVLDMKKSYLVLLMKVAMQLRQNFNVSDVAVEFVTGIDRKLFPYIEAWEDRLDLLAENIQIRPRFRPEVVEKAHKLLSEGKKDACRNFVIMSAMGDFRKKLDKEMELERQSFGRS